MFVSEVDGDGVSGSGAVSNRGGNRRKAGGSDVAGGVQAGAVGALVGVDLDVPAVVSTRWRLDRGNDRFHTDSHEETRDLQGARVSFGCDSKARASLMRERFDAVDDGRDGVNEDIVVRTDASDEVAAGS